MLIEAIDFTISQHMIENYCDGELDGLVGAGDIGQY